MFLQGSRVIQLVALSSNRKQTRARARTHTHTQTQGIMVTSQPT